MIKLNISLIILLSTITFHSIALQTTSGQYSWESFDKEDVKKKIDFENLVYDLCETCGKPKTNEHNIWILRGMTAVMVLSFGLAAFFALPLMGFGSLVGTSSSWASTWQATFVGVFAAGSFFSILTKLGIIVYVKILFGSVGAAMDYIFPIRHLIDWCTCNLLEYSKIIYNK